MPEHVNGAARSRGAPAPWRGGDGGGKLPGATWSIPAWLLAAAGNAETLEIALKLVWDAVNGAFDAEFAGEIARNTAIVAEAKEREGSYRRQVQATEKDIDDTPEWTPAAAYNVKEPKEGETKHAVRDEVPVGLWQLRHLVNLILSALMLVGLLFGSAVTVQATLAESGLPIFKHHPMLPWTMAILAPAAGYAIKSIGAHFGGGRAGGGFRVVVTVLAAIAFVAWAALYAWLFEGVSGTFDPFAEPPRLLVWGFNFLQIAAETLAGAAIFLNIEALFKRYSADVVIRTHTRVDALRRRPEEAAGLAAVVKVRVDAETRLAELNGLLKARLAAAELAVRNHRRRFGDES